MDDAPRQTSYEVDRIRELDRIIRIHDLGRIANRKIYFSRKCTLPNGDFFTHPKPYAYPRRKRKDAIRELKKIKRTSSDENIKKIVEEELKSCDRIQNTLDEMLGENPIGVLAWPSIIVFGYGGTLYASLREIYDLYK